MAETSEQEITTSDTSTAATWGNKTAEQLSEQDLRILFQAYNNNKLSNEGLTVLYEWMVSQVNDRSDFVSVYEEEGITYYTFIDQYKRLVAQFTTADAEAIKQRIDSAAAEDNITTTEAAINAAIGGNIDFATCNAVLAGTTSNRTAVDTALQYYLDHFKEMNEQYPELMQLVKNDEYKNTQMKKLVKDQVLSKWVSSSGKDAGTYGELLKNFGSASEEATRATAENVQKIGEALLGNSFLNVTDQDNFKLPDMGDYYLGDIDTTYAEKIDTLYRNLKDAHKALGYATKAPEETLGYNEAKNVYFLKAKVSLTEEDIAGGFMDCNFLTLSADTLESTADDKDSVSQFKKDLQARCNGTVLSGTAAEKMFELQILGITAPKVPRWCYEYNVSLDDLKYEVKTYQAVKEYSSSYVCLPKENDAVNINFVYICGKWHEAEYTMDDTANSGSTTVSFRWLLDPGDYGTEKESDNEEYKKEESAVKAAQKLLKYINDAGGEVYIKFEGCGITNGSEKFPSSAPSALLNFTYATQLQSFAEGDTSEQLFVSGLNRIHLQNYRRYLGEVYVKTPSEYGEIFINLSKLIANDDSDVIKGVTWNQDYEGENPIAFDTVGYDIDSRWFADAFFATMDELDDRQAIQKELHGYDWKDMLTWKVTLGDATFFVPPVNIRLQTTTQSERMPLLRAKGTATKTARRQTRVLAMDIFFNEDRGINGQDYTTHLRDPEKTEITYSMNGLRALESMFRFTPFLPITNDYINRFLGIDAVVMTALQISSVPSYPKLIHATLTMAEFDWRVYMPDIVQLELKASNGETDEATVDTSTDTTVSSYEDISEEEAAEAIADAAQDEEDTDFEGIPVSAINEMDLEYRNWFATSFNWETFRYYYQRPIRRGTYLKSLGWDFNSDLYISATCGGLTSFVPMDFQNPGIAFYMANEDYLNSVLKARYEYLQSGGTSGTAISFNEEQTRFLECLSELNILVQGIVNSEEFSTNLEDLNEILKQYPGYFQFTDTADATGQNFGINGSVNQSYVSNSMGMAKGCLLNINNCLSLFQQGIQDYLITNRQYFDIPCTYISNISKDGTTVSFGLCIKLSSTALSDSDMYSFKKNVTNFIGHDPLKEEGNYDGPIDSLFGVQENRIIIPITIKTKEEGLLIDTYKPIPGVQWEFGAEAPGMLLLSMASTIADKYGNGKGVGESVPDVNALMNLKYDKVELENVLVTHWSATITNRVANLHAINSDGFAPQYLGGEDIDIRITLQTTSHAAAAVLTAIPKKLTQLTRAYHHVMPCIPLRVESEFTKFLGVNEVTCEESFITTERSHPGLFTVEMHLISVDRTVREREAAVRRSAGNEGYRFYDNDTLSGTAWANLLGAGAGGVIGGAIATAAATGGGWAALGAAVAGGAMGAVAVAAGAGLLYGAYTLIGDFLARNKGTSFGSGKEQTQRYRHYFELKKALGEIDLYPDLELPSIAEMSAVGYHFVKYNFQDERVYVDPDFYFVYPIKLTSAFYRELAINSVEQGLADTKVTDAMGAEATLKPQAGVGYQITNTNDMYKKQQQMYLKAQEQLYQSKQDTRANSQQNLTRQEAVEKPLLSILSQSMEKEAWTICDKINVRFLEKRFFKEIQSYNARKEANKVGNVDTMRGTSNVSNTNNMNEKADKDSTDTTVVQSTNTDSTVSSTQVPNVYTEGSFVTEKSQMAVDSALDYLKYLQSTPIDVMIPSMAGNADTFYEQWGEKSPGVAMTEIDSAVSTFLQHEEVQKLLKAVYIDQTDMFKNLVTKIVEAAACAATGIKEYSGKDISNDWRPFTKFVAVKIGGQQNTSGAAEVRLDDPSPDGKKTAYTLGVKCGIQFGIFKLRMYTKDEITKLIHPEEEVPVKPQEKSSELGNVNYNFFLLDPYYRNSKVEDIENYKTKCITSVAFCTYAYLRLLTYWLVRLVYEHALPNITTDYFRGLSTLELNIENTADYYGKLHTGQEGLGTQFVTGQDGTLTALKQYVNFYNKNTYILDSGKIFAAAILASTDGDSEILTRINKRDYDALNALVETCANPATHFDAVKNPGPLAVRKLILALIGLKVIQNMGSVGSSQTNPMVATSRDTSQKLYIQAATDPKQFIPHSFHDMIVNDARGRMLRAFPTFYMTFIDEGREVGFWKLHDNFYNTSAILELEVIKSRKIPADTCHITMSNMFNSFATEMEDYITTPIASINDAWNSIFSSAEYFKTAEAARKNKPQEVKLRLRPGARIHVRMGYGNNAAMIPPMFNGVIAEVSSEETVNIIAQGDGIELMNPIAIDKEAHNIDKMTDFLDSIDNGATPLEISTALFREYPGLISEFVRKHLKLNLTARNPFGIVHFGDPDFTTFCKTGETAQNLYEMEEEPVYGGNGNIDGKFYGNEGILTSEKTKITFDMFQKTPWDVLNICKSIMPDARLAVIPFGFRSTCFMGMPHYYYCYDYYKDTDGVVKEKRKPFQQWHIYTSEQDIIGNGIAATNRDLKTVAVGLYQICESFNTKAQRTVGPLYADWDIYTEAQKTMVVDTNLLGKGMPYVGVLTNFISTMRVFGSEVFNVDALFPETGPFASHKKIAWRATATALRESVMDMYAGDLVLFGDPSVKPQDRVYINDRYTALSGQFLVKEVVHRMSVNDGFTTTVSPDCIAVVDDNNEIIKYSTLNRVGGLGASAAAIASDYAVSSSVFDSALTVAAWAGTGAIAYKAMGFAYHRILRELWHRAMNNPSQGLARGAKYRALQATRALTNANRSLAGGGVVKKALSKVASWGAKRAAGVAVMAGLGVACPPLAMAATIVFAAITVCDILIMPFLNNFLAEELKNYKVLKIYPLKKFGYAYTAGFEGARGTVYGSPTWEDRGSLGDLFDAVGLGSSPIANALSTLFFTDEVNSLANKYKRDNNIINADGTAAALETDYGKVSGHLVGDDFAYAANNYRSLQITPRATTKVDVLNSYNRFKVMDVNNYKQDSRMNSNRRISEDSRLKPYIEEQFFLVVHEDPGLPEGSAVSEETIKINGKEQRVKVVRTKDANGNLVFDVPVLNSEAIHVLYEIIRRAKNHMPSANATDPKENWPATKTDYIVLKSALRVGDKTSRASTGFTFVLQGTSQNSQRALKGALEELASEIKEKHNAIGTNETIFYYKQQDNNEVAITVLMPVVMGNPTDNEESADEGKSSDNNKTNDNTTDSDTASQSSTTTSDSTVEYDPNTYLTAEESNQYMKDIQDMGIEKANEKWRPILTERIKTLRTKNGG